MVTTPTLQVHETTTGRGEAYDGERLLAVVDYTIKEIQESLRPSVEPAPKGVGAPGERNICGVVKSPEAPVLRDYMGARLNLRLEDGRWLDFTVVKAVGPEMFLLQGLGGFQRAAA